MTPAVADRLDAHRHSVDDAVRLAPPAPDAPRIVIILPRGEAIRNFVHTGAIDDVARRADLSLVTVLPNDGYRRSFEQRAHRVLELHSAGTRWIVRIHRELLDMAHGRWLWSEAARERWRLRDLEASTPSARVKRAVKKLACRPFANQTGLAMLSAAERAASRCFRASDEYLRLFRELKPNLVFNGSHVHSPNAIQAVEAAQWLGIPTAAFVFSWDNLTSQGRILPPYDHYLVWNAALRDQLLAIYPSIDPERVQVTGTPQFDCHFRPEFHWTREEFCRRVGADPARPIVLYTTGMANHMPGEPRLVEDIAAMLRAMTDLGPPQLMVRVYPKDRTGRFEAIKRACPDVLFPAIPWDEAWLTPAVQDSFLLPNMLRHAAVGVNVASTVSLELCMFDRPVINVAYNPEGVDRAVVDYANYYRFDHYRPVVDSGSVILARSPADMRERLRDALTTAGPSLACGRRFLASMFGDTLDGRCAERVADTLLALSTAGRG
jgi:hypothetical protein